MLNPQDLITGVRWELLRRLAEKPQSGADLAKEIHTSAANVNQHLKLLELTGLVTKERVNGKTVHYKLTQDCALVTYLSDKPMREMLMLDAMDSLHLRLLVENKPRSRYLRRFLWIHDELVRGFISFGTVKEDSDELQLLVLAEDVKALRKEYANVQVGDRKVVIWSHTPDEFREGLNRKEHYFTDMLRRLTILYDPKGVLKAIKEAHK